MTHSFEDITWEIDADDTTPQMQVSKATAFGVSMHVFGPICGTWRWSIDGTGWVMDDTSPGLPTELDAKRAVVDLAWKQTQLEKLEKELLFWRGRAYAAEKFVSRLLMVPLSEAVRMSEAQLGHPEFLDQEWTGSWKDWSTILVDQLQAAIVKRQALIDKSDGPCPGCQECGRAL